MTKAAECFVRALHQLGNEKASRKTFDPVTAAVWRCQQMAPVRAAEALIEAAAEDVPQ